MDREDVVIGAGAAEPDRAVAARDLGQIPDLAVERGRPLGLAHFDLDAADAAHCGLHFSPNPRLPAFSSGPRWPGRAARELRLRDSGGDRRLGLPVWAQTKFRRTPCERTEPPPRAADRAADIADRVAALDWSVMATDLDAHGCAVTAPLLTADECEALAALYPADAPFRSRVIMARHGFGRGEYKYFAYPLPELDRGAAHRALSAARRDRQPLERGDGHRGPLSGEPRAFLERCHKAGQPQADAAAAAVRSRRLQLPAPGPLRRACVSAAGDGAAVAAGHRFLRRRVRADRAAPAHAVARRGRAARARARR